MVKGGYITHVNFKLDVICNITSIFFFQINNFEISFEYRGTNSKTPKQFWNYADSRYPPNKFMKQMW